MKEDVLSHLPCDVEKRRGARKLCIAEKPGDAESCRGVARGFTLVEAVLVIALAGFIIQAGAISFGRSAAKFRLQAAVWEIHTCLSQARFKAVWSGMPMRVSLTPTGYALEAYDEDAKTWLMQKSAVCEGVDIQANNAPTFYPQGTVSDLASIFVSNARGVYKFTIAISGRVKAVKVDG